MLFIGAITLLTVLLMWGIITFALAPQYNRHHPPEPDGKKPAAITAMILTRPDSEISSRDFGF